MVITRSMWRNASGERTAERAVAARDARTASKASAAASADALRGLLRTPAAARLSKTWTRAGSAFSRSLAAGLRRVAARAGRRRLGWDLSPLGILRRGWGRQCVAVPPFRKQPPALPFHVSIRPFGRAALRLRQHASRLKVPHDHVGRFAIADESVRKACCCRGSEVSPAGDCDCFGQSLLPVPCVLASRQDGFLPVCRGAEKSCTLPGVPTSDLL